MLSPSAMKAAQASLARAGIVVPRALDGEELHPNQQPTRVKPVAPPAESRAR